MKLPDITDERTFDVVDPVCGKTLDFASVVAHAYVDGWSFFFCSPRCKDSFISSPHFHADRSLRKKVPERSAS